MEGLPEKNWRLALASGTHIATVEIRESTEVRCSILAYTAFGHLRIAIMAAAGS